MIYRLPIRIYWEDTDAGGVVYYANYLKFLERARTEWIREVGFDQTVLIAERNLQWVVKRIQCDYLAPARLDDQLEVILERVAIQGARFTFWQEIVRAGGERLLTAEVMAASLRADSGRPQRMPADIAQAFAEHRPSVATNLPHIHKHNN